MNVIKTDIEGVVIIEPRIFTDARGYFFESAATKPVIENMLRVSIAAIMHAVKLRTE